jgi:uncharacterized membrane protein
MSAVPHARASRLRAMLPALVLLAWPFVVYWGLRELTARTVALVLLAVLLLRLLASGMAAVGSRAAIVLGAVLAAVAAAGDAALPLKLYPVAVNAALLGVFAGSLWRGPPVVERLARLRESVLEPEAVAYCRAVTRAWCIFFVGNGAIALATALAASDETWVLYNGVIAYLLIAAMFGGEWLVRKRLRRAAHG